MLFRYLITIIISNILVTLTNTVPMEDQAARVSAVSVKLPPFWPADPDLWFAQVEAQFAIKGVTTQKTKFDYVVSSLSPDFATEVRDLLINPPNDDPYDALKAQLIKRTAATDQQKLQQLLSGEELGDRRPTQLLRRMQQLVGNTPGLADGVLLRELFLQRLPANVRMVLASASSSTSLQDLAQMADKIVEVAVPSVSAFHTPSQSNSTELDDLRSEIATLKSTVKRLTRRRSPSPRPRPQDSQDQLCWYHERFGDAARKCKEPCSMSGKAKASH